MQSPSGCHALALAMLLASAPSAVHAAWCAQFNNGGNNCGFANQAQCMAAVSGVGGFCNQIGNDRSVRSAASGRQRTPVTQKSKTVVRSEPAPRAAVVAPATTPPAATSPPPAQAHTPPTSAAKTLAPTTTAARATGPDPTAFAAARKLILDGDYQAGLAMMQRLGSDNHPDVASYIGLAHRKLGRNTEARAWYDRALAADPIHLQTLAFSGVLRAEQGDLGGARLELRKIRAVCGNTTCNEYVGLAGVIAEKSR